MLKKELNLSSIEQSPEDIQKLLLEATEASEDLRSKLSHIKIKIKRTDEGVVKAIREIFGDSYISSEGDSIITYDMYCSIINLIRVMGNRKASEVL